MSQYAVTVTVASTFAKQVEQRSLEDQANNVLAAEQVQPESELSVFVTDDETIQDLNRRYRDINEPTDVLSFGLDDDPAFAKPPDSAPQAGEIVISFPTALQQASEGGHGVELELLHLLTHGLLHILGYNHETPDDARTMHAREEALLEGWRH
jgi:probable rRNA maturation factor